MKIDLDAVRTVILEGKNMAWNLVIEMLNGDRATVRNLEVKGGGYLISGVRLSGGSWGLISSPLFASNALGSTIAYNYQGDAIFATVEEGTLSDCRLMMPLGVTFIGTSVPGWVHETHLFNYYLFADLLGKSPAEVFELAGDFVGRYAEMWIVQLGGH